MVAKGRLQLSLQKPANQNLSPTEARAVSILIFIAALLCEHCDFNKLRIEQESQHFVIHVLLTRAEVMHTALRSEIDSITKVRKNFQLLVYR